MKLYMSRMVYRTEMPKDVVLGNFRNAAESRHGGGHHQEDAGLE